MDGHPNSRFKLPQRTNQKWEYSTMLSKQVNLFTSFEISARLAPNLLHDENFRSVPSNDISSTLVQYDT